MSDPINSIISKALSEGRKALLEHEALELARAAEIPTPRYLFTPLGSRPEPDFPPPYVLKIVSPDIIHKSDVGGVRLNIGGDELEREVGELVETVKRNAPNAEITGVLVMEMAEEGVETLVGLTRDPQFGPVVAFGLGGIFVEIYRDVSFRLAPIPIEEAREMIREVKAYKILSGYRGRPPADIDALADVIVKVSQLGDKYPEIMEMDINPLIAYPRGALAVDVRVILGE